MSEKKFSSYFVYAFGEITLVVIGILLALQFNSWSEDNQNQALVKKSLINLVDDLNFQISIIDEQHTREKEFIESATNAIKSLKSNNFKQLEAELLVIRSRRTFVSNKVTFTNMKENKIFTYLTDDELKIAIIKYYQNLDYTERVLNNNNLYLTDNQFGKYYLSNPMRLSLNDDGTVNYKNKVNKEMKYQMKLNIETRRNIAIANITHSGKTKMLTENLIVQIENALSGENQ